MRNFVVLLGAICLAGVSGIEWKTLHLKFDVLLDGYFNIPLTQTELEAAGYSLMTTDSELNVNFYSLPNDPRVSIGFDTYGNIAGVRVGYIKEDVGTRAESNGLTFPTSFYDDNAMFSSATYWDIDVWYNTVLFVSPEDLQNGGRVDTGDLVGENVYIKLEGEWTMLPRAESDAEANNFNEQACFLAMGKHYFYKMTNTSECADAPGVFILYEGGEMIGVGLIPYGSFTANTRTWFEDPSSSVVKMIAPNTPECITEWFDNYGSSAIHIFFKQNPRFTFC